MSYSFFKINQEDPELAQVALKYKTLRLDALTQSPSSFSSTFETESKLPDHEWLRRIKSPNKRTFICAITNGSQTKWVAQVTLRGPILAKEFLLPSESGQPPPSSDNEEEKWQMLSLYTLPDHRGKGLGKKLCQEAFRHLTCEQRGQASGILVRIMIKPENQVTIALYRSLGFEGSGSCTLEEALKANGDAELLPASPLGESYTKRTGVIMALRLKRR